MIGLQEWIYRLEVGEGAHWIKRGVGALALLALVTIYDLREYKNFSSQEAMDTAQLARNLAEGRGYTTDFIRPLSLRLVQAQRTDGDMGLKAPHPDLFNAPVYPALLAVAMKVLPFRYEVGDGTNFLTYQPEMLLAFVNQGIFFAAALLLFFLARRLFDAEVAWLATLAFLGADLFWRFSVSGLPNLLLVLVFLAVADLLTRLDAELRSETPRENRLLGFAAALGGVLAIGMLTRYAFGWLLVPVLVFVALYAGARRGKLLVVTALVFCAAVTPWLWRNHSLSGHWFGGAGYAVLEGTEPHPGSRLQRSLQASTATVDAEMYLRKLIEGVDTIVREELPTLGGSWVTAFFFVGLLVPFHNPGLNRLRGFLLMSLAVWIPVQALGRTHLSVDSPLLNSENLLVLVVPLVLVYGVGLFFLLLDQLALSGPQLRFLAKSAFVAMACLPLIIKLLPPRSFPLAYPPYYPPWVQLVSGWMQPDELMMSDVPWAVAWYGDRSCVWAVADADKDFYAINDYQRPVKGLYLTHVTTDAKFYSKMVKPDEKGWEWFVMQSVVRTNIPPGFPLKVGVPGFLQEGQLFLTDWERWQRERK